jgi:hypothetical protein
MVPGRSAPRKKSCRRPVVPRRTPGCPQPVRRPSTTPPGLSPRPSTGLWAAPLTGPDPRAIVLGDTRPPESNGSRSVRGRQSANPRSLGVSWAITRADAPPPPALVGSDASMGSKRAATFAGGLPPESNRRPHPYPRCAGSSRRPASPHVPMQPRRRKALPRVGSLGGVRLRVAQFLANIWQGPLRGRLWHERRWHRPGSPNDKRPHLRCSAVLG